jgi:hypothetical protein
MRPRTPGLWDQMEIRLWRTFYLINTITGVPTWTTHGPSAGRTRVLAALHPQQDIQLLPSLLSCS